MWTNILKLTLFLLFFTGRVVGDTTMPLTPSLSPKAPSVAAVSYLLLDYNTNTVLAEKNSTLQVEPASLTKMLTVFIVDNEIRNGKIKPTDEVTISKHAWQTQGSRMFVQVGTKVKVEDLVKGVIIQSGNDASIALAEHIAGSEQAFADLMNSYAQMLGMKDSHFVNVTGLPDKAHISSAQDMAILARALIKNFPETYKIYSQKEFTYNNIRQANRNRLLWRNDLVDGIKTGYTESAGYCLVASGVDNNSMRLIALVMGTKSDKARTEEANKLLNWGFRFYESHLVLKAGDALQQPKIWMGAQKRLPVGFADDLGIVTVRGDYNKYTATTNINSFIKAPINRGDVVGSYIVHNANKEVILERPIIALLTVTKGNIWQRGRDYVKLNVKNVFHKNKN